MRQRSIRDLVVTLVGISNGLGPETARQLAGHGARLVLVSHSKPALRRLCDDIQRDSGRVSRRIVTVDGDTADPETAQRAVSAARDEFGGSHALIYNANLAVVGASEEVPIAVARRLMEVNFFGAFHFTKAFLPEFLNRDGHFVFVTGQIARTPLGNLGSYCAARAALDVYAETLERELSDTRVGVSRYWPGTMETDFSDQAAQGPATGTHVPAGYSSLHSVSPDRAARGLIRLLHSRARFAACPAISLELRRRFDAIRSLTPMFAEWHPGARARRRQAVTTWNMVDTPTQSAGYARVTRNLQDRVLMVVGASGGLGAAISFSLAKAGAKTVLCGRSEERLHHTRQSIRDRGWSAELQPFDVTDAQAVQEAVASVHSRHGQVDGLIFAAGIATLEPVQEMEFARLKACTAVNYEGLTNCARSLLPRFRERSSGILVNVSVAIGERPMDNLSAFGASKLASNMYIRALNQEVKDTGIESLIVVPGPIDTAFMAHLLNAEQANFSFCMRERRALGLIPVEKAAAGVIRAIEDGDSEYWFPATMRAYVAFSHAISHGFVDHIAKWYMDWKKVPEICEMPAELSERANSVYQIESTRAPSELEKD